MIDFVVDNHPNPIPEGYIHGGMGVYLHGNIDQLAKYDICASSIDLKDLPDGIYPVTYDYEISCTLFFWSFDDRGHKRIRGFVVSNDDHLWMADAQSKFDNKVKYL